MDIKKFLDHIEKELTSNFTLMSEMGKRFVELIEEEARKEFAKQTGLSGQGLPETEEFFKSFHYHVKGKSLSITCDWPWIDELLEGRLKTKMTWLRSRPGKPLIVPMRDKNGHVIFRTAPISANKLWVHPGVAKHTFLEKAKQRFLEEALQEAISKIKL